MMSVGAGGPPLAVSPQFSSAKPACTAAQPGADRNAAASRAARMGLVAAADLGCSHARELACVLL
jgi:hypothetical protein